MYSTVKQQCWVKDEGNRDRDESLCFHPCTLYSTYDRRTANTFYYWRPKRLAGTGREGLLYTQPGGPVGLGGISLRMVVQYVHNGVSEPA